MSDRKRLLNDLRVIDLRAELEKRNLDKSGVRGVLIQRLTKHLKEEGHDPETYKFDLPNAESKTPSKKTRRSESTVEAEDTPAMEDMIVQDDAGDDDDGEVAEPTVETANADAEPPKMDVEEEKPKRKRESSKDTPDVVSPKKPCIVKEEQEEEVKTENNIDAEDSINLDLGEDELLNEETDNTTKDKKDDAAAAAATTGAPDDEAPTEDPQEQSAEQPATSDVANDSKDKDSKDDKDKEDDKKDKRDDGKEGARNLWVSGLSGDTRAKDLKQLCSKHGKVIGAKVVTNARTPGSRCYGYVTMASSQDAENCIKNLHRTELHGRMISVEKAKSEAESSRRQPGREHRTSKDDKENGQTEGTENGDKDKKKDGEGERSPSHNREKSHRSDKDTKARRSTRSRERRRSPREVLSFSKIWKERDLARARERSRAAREEERRRRAAEDALRERERRQRQEKHRLQQEREKLRAEREKIEREKNELLRLERERHRLEREKLELERLELKRAQLRLEEERRKRGYEGAAAYRKPSPPEPYERDPRHKRPPAMSSRGAAFEAPPPPRFELPAPAYSDKRERDYKRDYPRHVSSASNPLKYGANGGAAGEERPAARGKEPARAYDSRDRAYRSPPAKPDPRWGSARYPDAAPPAKANPSSGEQWSGASSEARYGAAYEPRYAHSAYQPAPPGTAYTDRYAPQREYRKY